MTLSANCLAPSRVLWIAAFFSLVTACGGGEASPTPTPPVTYTAASGVAQKGPLIKGSTVTAQQLNAMLSPTGTQYTYQITSDLGTFSPTTPFTSQYIGVIANGYYFDEVQNAVSNGPITLNGYSDLAVDKVLNVNLLTTLAYQRIQNLITSQNLSFTAARTQAENEVLAALNIPSGSYGSFGTLDLSGSTDGDHILVAISSIFVYGNTAGTLSQLIANFQSDIGTNGVITNSKTTAALVAAAEHVNPAAVAANFTQYYAAENLTFTASDITDWIAQSGDGVIGKFVFQVADATPSSVFTFPASVVSQFAGTPVTVTAGQLSVNGTPASGSVSFNAGDIVTVSPTVGDFPNGVLTSYMVSGKKNLAKVSFISGLVSIAVTPAAASVPVGLTEQFTATGTFSDTSTANLTNIVTWTSGTPTVAYPNANSGLFNANALGSTLITAASGSVSGSATLTVTPAIVESITITPNPALTGIGANAQLTATGYFSDGTTHDVTTAATWSSGTPSVATVGPSTGLTTGVSLGSSTITAAIGSATATASLWVVSQVFTLASADASILAVSDTNFVYSSTPTGSIHLYSGSSDTILPTDTIQNLANWTVTNGGYVFADGSGSDRPGISIYSWPPDATAATNLSLSAGSQSSYDRLLPVHYPWVLWASLINTWSQYTLYNVSTAQNLTITEPAGATSIANAGCDFATINGQLNLFYSATSPGAGGTSNYNVYGWNQGTNASTQISNDNVSIYPQTDGTFVAWQSSLTLPPAAPPFTLSLRNIASNTTAVLSSNMSAFQLSSGLVGWLDQTTTLQNGQMVTSTAVRASDGTTTTTISSTVGDSRFIGSSGGYVIFEETDGAYWNLYAWSATGGRQLIFGGTPSGVFLAGKTIYFTYGDQQWLYAVTLP